MTEFMEMTDKQPDEKAIAIGGRNGHVARRNGFSFNFQPFNR
jgi:hypothetical protein